MAMGCFAQHTKIYLMSCVTHICRLTHRNHCLSLCLPIHLHLYVCQSIHLSLYVCPSVHSFVCPSICPYVCPFICLCLSVCPSSCLCMFVCPLICLSIHLSLYVCPSICLYMSVHLSVCHTVVHMPRPDCLITTILSQMFLSSILFVHIITVYQEMTFLSGVG